METLVIYFLKMILVSGVMFGYYFLFLKDKTFHHYNRFYMIFTLVMSVILPFLKISDFTIETDTSLLLAISKINSGNYQMQEVVENSISWWQILGIAIAIISMILIGKILLGIVQIQRFKSKFPHQKYESIHFYQTDLENAPFSFFRSLFWKQSLELQSDLGKQILKHELIHIEQKHSLDKMLVEFLRAIFWFNPFFYLIKKELNLIHEYLADHKAFKRNDTRFFAELILYQNFSGKEFPLTSPFFSSNLKKRLMMIQKPTTKFGYARRFLALPIIFVLTFTLLVNAKNKEIEVFNAETANIKATIIKELNNPNSSSNNELTNNLKEENLAQKDSIITKKNAKKEKDNSIEIFPVALSQASDKNGFLLLGKEVSKKEMVDFYLKNKDSNLYEYGTSSSVAQNLDKAGKSALFSINKKGEFPGLEEYYKKYKPSFDSNYSSDPNFFTTITKENIKSKKDSLDFVNFFNKEEKLRLERYAKSKKEKEKIKSKIAKLKENSPVYKNFYKGRDYDKNPITEEEKIALTKEAEEIKKMWDEKAKKEEYGDMVIFKADELTTNTFDVNGKFIENRKDSFRYTVMPMNSRNAQYFIDGKKVSKKEFLKMSEARQFDLNFFKDQNNVKVLNIDRVTDGKNLHTMRYEITKN